MNELSVSERATMQYYLVMNEEALFRLWGVYSQEGKGLMFSPEAAENTGRSLFKSAKAAIRRRICLDWKYCEKAKDPFWQDEVSLGCVLAGLLVDISLGAPVLMVSALLVKLGLAKFCGCNENDTRQ